MFGVHEFHQVPSVRDNEAELANILVKLQHLLQERVGSGSYCLGSRLGFAWSCGWGGLVAG